MMNNKGQSLVLFVLIIPIILFILILIIDIGNAYTEKIKLDNTNYLAIEYGIEHKEEENLENKLIDLLIKNDENINEMNINIEEDYITIKVDKKAKGIIINNIDLIKITSSYKAYIKDNKKIIERV